MHSYVFPGDLDKEIAAIGSQPIPYMRTEEFSKSISNPRESFWISFIAGEEGQSYTLVPAPEP